MEDQRTSEEKLQQEWISSLLASAANEQDHTRRIERAMTQIERAEHRSVSTSTGWPLQRRRFMQFATAAVLVIGCFLLSQSFGNQSLKAAIERSLSVAAEQIPRKYELKINYRRRNGTRQSVVDELYVQGNDRFALRHPGLVPGTNCWIGEDRGDAWVLPAFGPVLKGNQTALGRWLQSQEDLDTPYLHVSSALTRMLSQGYKLESLEHETLTVAGSPIVCEHIRATRFGDDAEGRAPPDVIDLWASSETGIAARIVARWESAREGPGRESVEITFLGEEPSLPLDWFRAEGHYEGVRASLRFDRATSQ